MGAASEEAVMGRAREARLPTSTPPPSMHVSKTYGHKSPAALLASSRPSLDLQVVDQPHPSKDDGHGQQHHMWPGRQVSAGGQGPEAGRVHQLDIVHRPAQSLERPRHRSLSLLDGKGRRSATCAAPRGDLRFQGAQCLVDAGGCGAVIGCQEHVATAHRQTICLALNREANYLDAKVQVAGEALRGKCMVAGCRFVARNLKGGKTQQSKGRGCLATMPGSGDRFGMPAGTHAFIPVQRMRPVCRTVTP